jgi:hypothetical protein
MLMHLDFPSVIQCRTGAWKAKTAALFRKSTQSPGSAINAARYAQMTAQRLTQMQGALPIE